MDMENNETQNEETPTEKSFPWGAVLGLVAIGAIGVIGFAVTRKNPTPEPEPTLTYTRKPAAIAVPDPAPDPKPAPVYVDIRSLTADAKRDEVDVPMPLPTPRVPARPSTPRTAARPTARPTARPAVPEPEAEVPTTVAKGTGVIAVKKGGKAVVATVAKVADKPLDPSSATSSDSAPQDSAGAAPTTKPAAAPRIYGAEPPKPVTDPNEIQLPFQHRRPTPRPSTSAAAN